MNNVQGLISDWDTLLWKLTSHKAFFFLRRSGIYKIWLKCQFSEYGSHPLHSWQQLKTWGKWRRNSFRKAKWCFLGKESPPIGTTGGGGEILFLSYDATVTICGTDIYVILVQKMIWGYWKWTSSSIKVLLDLFPYSHIYFFVMFFLLI